MQPLAPSPRPLLRTARAALGPLPTFEAASGRARCRWRAIRPPACAAPLMSPDAGLSAAVSSFTSLRSTPHRPDPPPVAVRAAGTPNPVAARKAVPGAGDFWGGEERSVRVGARSALRQLTCRSLFGRSERSERSEFSGSTRTRAPQWSRRGRPPRHEPAPGSACRASSTVASDAQQTLVNARKGPQAADRKPRRRPRRHPNLFRTH
jgi:hypothetical protein